MLLVVLLAPVAATPQQAGKVYRIGYVSPRPGIELQEEAFRQSLRELGYVEGQNLVIDWRFAKGETALFPSMAAELVRLNVDCMVTIGVLATQVAKQATATIPIVMKAADEDPVRLGLIASFARPGGNITGIVNVGHELAGKRLQLLREVVPQLQSLTVHAPDDVEGAFNSALKGRAHALVVAGTDFINSHRARIISLAAKTRLPAIYTASVWPYEGGLMSYGTDRVTQFRRAASFVDRIFKGTKPADLAVEQVTKYELIVNLRVAKALGLTISPSFLSRADHVITD